MAEKEQPIFEDPSFKASRIQQAKVDFSGVSRRLRTTLSKTHLISNPSLPNADGDALANVAVTCGASKEEVEALRVGQVVPLDAA